MNDEVIKGDKQLNYLLVEGPDDAQVFFHLFRYFKLDDHITMQQKGGIDELIASLRVELRRRAETRLAIVVDADIDLAARWQALRHKLLEAEYKLVPLQPNPSGTILRQEGRPVVGIWLMPTMSFPVCWKILYAFSYQSTMYSRRTRKTNGTSYHKTLLKPGFSICTTTY